MRYLFWSLLLCTTLFFVSSCTDSDVNQESQLSEEIVTKDGEKNLKIPPIEIENVTVDACYTKKCTKYDFLLDLCDIYIPTTQIHVYAKPTSNTTWIYLGVANQVGSNDFLFEVSTCVNVVYVPGQWEMRGLYSYVNPATLFDCTGTTYCSFCKLFTMPVPSGPCKKENPDCLQGSAFESVPCENISSMITTYIDDHIFECQPEFSPCGGGICSRPVEHHEVSTVFEIDANGNVDLDAIIDEINAQIAEDIEGYFEPNGYPCSIGVENIEVECSGDQGFLIIEYRLIDLCYT